MASLAGPMPTHQRIITLIVACSLFMQAVDSTVLGTALTTIARDFGTDPVRLHMTMTAYLLSLAVFMPLSGWVADRYGTRDVFRVAVAIFTLASVACAFAPSLRWLVLARIVQGMGGAMMLPVARLALLRAVPKNQLVNALAWVSIPALIGPVIGPPLGGFIVTYWSWPWIFWINVPIGIFGIALATRYLDDVREPRVPPIDLTGFVLVAVGFTGLILGFETIGDALMPPWANYLAVLLGMASLAAYAGHARRAASPIIDLSLLRVQTFLAGVAGGGLVRIGIGALPFLLPLMLQSGFGYSPLASGMTTLAAALGALTMKFGAQALIRLYGFRTLLTGTALLSAVSVAVCALFSPSTAAWLIFLVLLVGGFFRSLAFTALNAIAYADLEPSRMSQATSFAALVQQLALSVGVGLAAMLLDVARGAHETPQPDDFAMPFLVIGAIISLAAFSFARLPPEAGNEMANRGPAPVREKGPLDDA
jgi:EmrB/QacA subfamily drug resistance transporter